MKKLVLSTVLALSLSSQSWAVYYWGHTVAGSVPFVNATMSAATNAHVYVIASDGTGMFAYMAADGTAWAKITLPAGTPVAIVQHQGSIYLYMRSGSTTIYRRDNHTTWTPVRNFTASVVENSTYSDGIHLYHALTDMTVERATGSTGLTWGGIGQLTSSNVGTNAGIRFFQFKGDTFALRIVNTGSLVIREFHRLSNSSWSLMGTLNSAWYNSSFIQPDFNHPSLVEHNGWIYLNHVDGVWRSQTFPFQWQNFFPISSGLTKPGTVANVSGTLMLFAKNETVKELGAGGNWISSAVDAVPNFKMTATTSNRIFVFPEMQNDFWTLSRGVVTMTPKSIPGSTMFSGQTSVAVLGLSMKTNGPDRVKLSINNFGTATQDSISAVRLGKSNSGTVKISAAATVTLSPDPVNKKRWVLATPFEIQDGDDLFFTVDIAQAPKDGETVVFYANDIRFEVNTSFFFITPVFPSQAFDIKNIPVAAAPADPIEGVLVYPQPARDTVRFLYDLDSGSDINVKIYDRNGALLSEVSDPGKPAGNRAQTQWDASNKAPGVYYALIEIKSAEGKRNYKKKIVIER